LSDNYFNRQIQLWGIEKQKLLSTKKIAIIGCGGLGNSIAIALSGLGLKEIHLVDFDKVALHNIHRQISFKLSDVDKYKSEVLQQFLTDRNNLTKIYSYKESFEEFISNKNKNKKIEFDIIFDATDNLQTRVEINRFSKKNSIPWVYGSVEEFNGQVCLFKNSDFEEIFKIEKPVPKGITAPMVMNIASLQALYGMKYLIKDDNNITTDNLHYLYFENDILKIKNFKLPN